MHRRGNQPPTYTSALPGLLRSAPVTQHPDLTEQEVHCLIAVARGTPHTFDYQLEAEVLSNLGYLVRTRDPSRPYVVTYQGRLALDRLENTPAPPADPLEGHLTLIVGTNQPANDGLPAGGGVEAGAAVPVRQDD